MPMTQKEMIKLLKKNGFVIVPKQGKGSHVKMMKKGLSRSITIPHGELNKYTQNGILKEAGLK
jgi:predicted RNA binding protein YcfA (HicA-like mRNA interferase family)